MARTAYCPTCDTNVKVPDAARRGSLVRCPSCDETFQPPFLKPITVANEDDEPFDPHTGERYSFKKAKPGEQGRAVTDDAKKAVQKEIRRERRDRPKFDKHGRGLFEGVEGFFLLSGILLAIGIPLAFFGMRRLAHWSPELAGGVIIGVCFILFLIGFCASAELRARMMDWFWGTTRR